MQSIANCKECVQVLTFLFTVKSGLAKITVSENLFWSDFNTFTNFLETLPLIMVTICSVTIDIVLRQRAQAKGGDDDHFFFLRSMVAITTPLLWLRVLSFIKNWNKHLATFILCSFEVRVVLGYLLLPASKPCNSLGRVALSKCNGPPPMTHYITFS